MILAEALPLMPMSGRPFLPVRVEDLDEKEAALAAQQEAYLRSRTSTGTVPAGRHCCKATAEVRGIALSQMPCAPLL
jgi:hypothetical protein